MKKIYMNQFLLAGTLTGCLFLASCDKEQEFTTGMPEQQLINSIELEVTSKLPLAVGMDSTIVYKVAPEDAADKEVMWTSSNEKVAAVSQNGTITALTEGEAVITVKPVIGFGVTDVTEKTITVSVIPEIIEVTDIRLTNKDDEGNPLTSLYPGDEQKLTYTLLPENHTYSYLTCTRQPETIHIEPREVVIIEGILALCDKKLRNMMDLKIFVDADPDERLIRVIQRDVIERGRTAEAVMERYTRVLKPMHLQFIEPCKRYADLIVPEGGNNKVAIDILTMYIKKHLKN